MDGAVDNPTDVIWRALSDPTRRTLLDRLRTGPKTTGDLVASVHGMSRFGVMKHLGVLVDAGLVTARKEGRQRWNHLNAVPLKLVFDRWVSKYEDQWADALIRLKNTAEREHEMSTKLLDSQPRNAQIALEIDINAPRADIFRVWLEEPHKWFYENEESRDATPTRIEPKMGGKWYLELPNGGFNVIAEITMIKPNNKIRFKGDCTCPEAFMANMTVAFEDIQGGTKVTIDHRMSGEFSDEHVTGFQEGWLDGLTKLKTLMEA